MLERAFEDRHDFGGLIPSLVRLIQHEDFHHVLAATIGVTGALLVFNALFVVRRHIDKQGLLKMFRAPLPDEAHDGR